MIDPIKIGRLVAEAVLNDPGPCFYPGKFKPPHKGHFDAAISLATKDYITKVYVLISSKEIEGITPEDSLSIWNKYLQAQPNQKITVRIATDESPVVSIIKWLKANPEINPVYVAVGEDETDDENYGESLQRDFGDRVKIIKVQEKIGNISAPVIRNYLRDGDYESFAETVPEAAFNRGAAPEIFKTLASKMENESGPKEA
jgi:phosphopantetheine adenylyltransferase